MELICLGSSSKGNGYVLTNGKEALVLEAGVPYQKVIEALHYRSNILSGCLISHIHGDHAKYVNEYLDGYVDVYGSGELNLYDRRITSVEHLTERNNRAGRFYFRPFKVEHDAECYGYYIYHPEMGYLLFVTDTAYIRQKFTRIDHVMIECNYSKEILEENYHNGLVTKVQRDRVITSHMSLDTCIETLKANNLDNVKNIILLHLSDGNSNEEQFIAEVVKMAGKRVYAANKGIVIEINKDEF